MIILSIQRIPFTHSGVPDKQPPSDEEGFQLYVTHSCIETLSHSVIKPTATLHHPKLPMQLRHLHLKSARIVFHLNIKSYTEIPCIKSIRSSIHNQNMNSCSQSCSQDSQNYLSERSTQGDKNVTNTHQGEISSLVRPSRSDLKLKSSQESRLYVEDVYCAQTRFDCRLQDYSKRCCFERVWRGDTLFLHLAQYNLIQAGQCRLKLDARRSE